jgi:thiol:disulfide interchange protein/DsbC/DsbD-like thiol-disulfide interchange protein
MPIGRYFKLPSHRGSSLLKTALSVIVLAAPLFSLSSCRDKSVGTGSHLEVKLISDQTSITPGSSFTLGVHFKPEPGWHIYWKNPGDSGLAPKFAWQSTGGVSVDAPLWPYPERIEVGPLVNYGYGEVLLPFTARFSQSPSDASSVTVTLSTQWLVCKDECVPGEAELQTTLPISAKPGEPSQYEALFARSIQQIPTNLDRVSIAVEEQQDQIIIALIPLEPRFFPSHIIFFPEDPRVISNSAPQEVALEGGALRITLRRDPNVKSAISRVRGVLYSKQGWTESGQPKAILIDTNPETTRSTAPNSSTPSPLTPQSQQTPIGFLSALLLALLGGLFLNIMPCVFPVLSIKILSFIEQAAHDESKIRKHGLSFAAGAIVSFWAFAATLLALRASGEELGWGFQLQSPLFVATMIFTLLLLALLFLSDVSLGASIQRLAGSAKLPTSYVGSFLNGALATAVATPCTGPFMGSALAATLTLPASLSFLIFTMLGVGMSLPYVVIAYRPQLLHRLPKPGAWMESFKQLMAFPLFASIVWLVRVFARQMNIEGLELSLLSDLLWGTLLISFGFWIALQAKNTARKPLQRALIAIALILCATGITLGIPSSAQVEGTRSRACIASESSTPEPDAHGLIWEPYSEKRLASLIAEKRSVYLDFTAEWCITCQVNERVVFSSAEVRGMIMQKNVALMRGDWTSKSPMITAALRRYGRNGVPLNVLIRNGDTNSPIILPNLLTPGLVLAELEKLP